MNRKIMFRGKRIDNGQWVEGHFTKWKHFNGKGYVDSYAITPPDESPILVTPETVGQYTGRGDGFGNRIFEGDIISFARSTYKVYWCKHNMAWVVAGKYGNIQFLKSLTSDSKVIGNIHDNAEFLNS